MDINGCSFSFVCLQIDITVSMAVVVVVHETFKFKIMLCDDFVQSVALQVITIKSIFHHNRRPEVEEHVK